MIQVVGLAGLFLIAAAWAVNILRGSPPPPLDLTLLYFLGSVALTIYAATVGDGVFTILNAASSLLSLVNLFRLLKYRSDK